MKAIIVKNLNLRVRPSVNSPNPTYYSPGKEIEIVDTVTGDSYKDNNIWYKLDNGGYVWSGGILSNPQERNLKLDKLIDYRNEIRLSKPLPSSGERKKIRVAILDTGILEDHPDFDGKTFDQKLSKNYTASKGFIDVNGHGTQVAGIIGGRSDDSIGVKGICPDCQIINVKVLEDDRASTGTAVREALQYLAGLDVDIVNMSFSIPKNSYEKFVKSHIQELSAKGVVFVCAGEDNERLVQHVFFPAFSDDVISIGSASQHILKETKISSLHSRIDFVVPEFSFNSCSVEKYGFYRPESGCSFAAAVVTGLLAELKAHNPSINTKALALEELNKIALTHDDFKTAGFQGITIMNRK